MKQPQLNAYSLMAASFLLMHADLRAEIVYVDLSPDLVLDPDTTFDLDMDMDGNIDFQFVVNAWIGAVWGGYYGSYTFSSMVKSWQSVRAKAFGDNAMVTVSSTSTSKGTVYNFAGVDPLEIWDLISYKDDFNSTYGAFHMANKFRLLGYPSYEPLGDWIYAFSINPWNYNALHGEEHYAGLRFTDADDCVHYGWIRCAVVDSNQQLILKDYAYESYCNWAIYTGDTSGGHVEIQEPIRNAPVIFGSVSAIHIHVDQSPGNTQVHIFELNGKLIYCGKLNQQQTEIEIGQPGIYMVTVSADENKFTQKVCVY